MNNIKSLRIASCLTQTQLATEIGVSQQAVGKWERHECDPQWEMAPRLAKVLGCSIDELFEPIGEIAG